MKIEQNVKLDPNELVQLGDVYRAAFAGPPWFEVSKCAGNGCEGGFSPQKIGEACLKCLKLLAEEAYPQAELEPSILERLSYPGAKLYREFSDGKELLLAAIFWEDPPAVIGAKKYRSEPPMQNWLATALPQVPLVWLDEIFANRSKRPTGNLWNFEKLVASVFSQSESRLLAFRTINEGLMAKSRRLFGDDCRIYKSGEVPDRRNFVTIRRNENE